MLPLIALGLFYGIVNLQANTGGQFATLLYTDLAGVSVSTAGLIGVAVLVVSFLSALTFMRVIERPSRMTFFLVGGVLYTLGGVVYGLKRPNPSPRWFGFHEVFHSFTILAFAAHYVGVSLATYSLR